ncbi:hypothetical protein HNY73_012255 [Argiope bruennichi]|uniref:Uncharacterized protein n=1 Tax=Argiope bruennichi TaxID=94029 RepID=A0A8T0EUG6_ARGBR|nr:hypothetical protein HNY73_012255 [Argiope bruennichi]
MFRGKQRIQSQGRGSRAKKCCEILLFTVLRTQIEILLRLPKRLPFWKKIHGARREKYMPENTYLTINKEEIAKHPISLQPTPNRKQLQGPVVSGTKIANDGAPWPASAHEMRQDFHRDAFLAQKASGYGARVVGKNISSFAIKLI